MDDFPVLLVQTYGQKEIQGEVPGYIIMADLTACTGQKSMGNGLTLEQTKAVGV